MIGIKNRSLATIREYHYDLRDTLKFLKLYINDKIPFGKIDDEMISQAEIKNLDINFFKKVQLEDLHSYLNYLTTKRLDKPRTRARKIATIKSFFNYLTLKKKVLEKNPSVELETPKLPKRLPKYLTLDESVTLLHSVDGKFEKRDLCILTLFLNCGLRLSELININMKDIKDNILTVIGKGNKERSIYLNETCQKALS